MFLFYSMHLNRLILYLATVANVAVNMDTNMAFWYIYTSFAHIPPRDCWILQKFYLYLSNIYFVFLLETLIYIFLTAALFYLLMPILSIVNMTANTHC